MDSDTDDDNQHFERYQRRMEADQSAINDKGTAAFCLDCLQDRAAAKSVLAPGNWISSGLIHFFIEYYRRIVCERVKMKERVFFFQTTFMTDFSRSLIKKHEARVPPARDLFTYDFWVFPVHVKETHWALAIVCHPIEEKKAKIVILDSFISLSTGKGDWHEWCVNLRNIKVYFQQQYARKYKEDHNGTEIEQLPLWVADIVAVFPAGTPQQQNSFDCGVFLIFFLRVFLFTAYLEDGKSNAWCSQVSTNIEEERKRLLDVLVLVERASEFEKVTDLVPESLVQDIGKDALAVAAAFLESQVIYMFVFSFFF